MLPAAQTPSRTRRLRVGLAWKLLASLVLSFSLAVFLLSTVATRELAKNLRSDFQARGEAIAIGLAGVTERSIEGDPLIIDNAILVNRSIRGVKYIFVQDGNGQTRGSTFSQGVPEGLAQQNTFAADTTFSELVPTRGREITLGVGPGASHVLDLVAPVRVIDVNAPEGRGRVGAAHVGMDLDEVAVEVESLRRKMLLASGEVALIGILLHILGTTWIVLRPVRELTRMTSGIVNGDRRQVNRGLEGSLHLTNDEIGDLARAFRVMSEAVAFREERLNKEIELAQRIQTSLLPQSLTVPNLELAATMVPAKRVGGDYYDVLPVDRGCWIGIGDVSGHGLDAGLIMLMTQSIVAALVARDPRAAPRDIVCVLNEVLFDNIRNRLRRDDHVTLTLLHYDESGSIVFAGAHEDIIVYRAKEKRCELVPTAGTWLGGRRDLAVVTVDSSLTLQPGDVMLIYTDGVIELRNGTQEQFGIERLCAGFAEVHDQPVGQIRDHLLLRIGEWGVADDDVTVLVARYVNSPGSA
jgi:serine phosphatase RsbU (regulator of sigma subunit)